MHGGDLSSEVCALVVDAWEMRGDARYLAARGRADGNADLSRSVAGLLAGARQCTRDAWELAAREAAARARVSPADLHRQLAEAFGPPAPELPRAPRQETPGGAVVIETADGATDDTSPPAGDQGAPRG
jgi:hypothetical protein